MQLAAWLLTLIGPLVVRALIVLGISTVTYTGVTASLDGLIGMAQNSWVGLPQDLLQLASIAGVTDFLGIITGAMSTRVTLWVASMSTRWITGGVKR